MGLAEEGLPAAEETGCVSALGLLTSQRNFAVYLVEGEIFQHVFSSLDSHKTNLFLFPSTLLNMRSM